MFADLYKHPYDVLERELDWSAIVPIGSTIEASEWLADDGLTVEDAGTGGLVTRARVGGGSANLAYTVSNRVTLASGLRYERSFQVLVREL
ncbi:MAG: hypothetical protein HY521_13085 [Proteobacteria bacterium]|nr:hypothetical protein [Pseudomonadota bacterium]